MRKSNHGQPRRRASAHVLLLVVLSMVAATLTMASIAAPDAGAQGPPYNGPQTGPTGPAFFGPAPNPVPYCESPTYFDPFPENVNPVGELDPGAGPEASVTTGGITMDFDLTAEGDPGGQYPGFFPAGGQGAPNDQPKGVEMAAGDAATVALSDFSVNDEVFVTSGDPSVVAQGGLVFQFNSGSDNNLRAYEPGEWSQPLWEISVGLLADA